MAVSQPADPCAALANPSRSPADELRTLAQTSSLEGGISTPRNGSTVSALPLQATTLSHSKFACNFQARQIEWSGAVLPGAYVAKALTSSMTCCGSVRAL